MKDLLVIWLRRPGTRDYLSTQDFRRLWIPSDAVWKLTTSNSSPVSTTRVDGPSTRVVETGLHCSCMLGWLVRWSHGWIMANRLNESTYHQWLNRAWTRHNAVPVVFLKPERRSSTPRQAEGGTQSANYVTHLATVFQLLLASLLQIAISGVNNYYYSTDGQHWQE